MPSTTPADPLPVVLITGCSSGGIGYELARALALSKSAKVIATARDVSKMKGLSELGGSGGILALLPLDVTDETSVSQAASQVLDLTNDRGCDILVNNAGMTFKGTVLDSEVSATARLFNANVFGLLRTTHAFTRAMVARGRGLIVNVGSATNYVHQATKSSYSASKHAVRCLTDVMRIELSPFNVRVFLVSPGYVATPIDDKAGEEGRWFVPKVRISPYAPQQQQQQQQEGHEKGGESSASASIEDGFQEICTATKSSIFEFGPGASAGAMLPSVFSAKLAAVVLREWRRTFPAKGKVTRPPTAREYFASMVWLPTLLGGPVRHWREAPFASVAYFIGGFLPLWLQDVLLSWSGGLILKKSK